MKALSKPALGGCVVTAALVLGAALTAWPHALGGSTTYLVTRGASMKPAFSSGALILLRPSESYAVGDVAAYRNAALHRVVVHRIVAVDADRYTFKGDANKFLDPQAVRRSEIVGKPSLRVPKVGSALLWLTSPFNAALVALLVALLVWTRPQLRELMRTGRAAAPSRTPEAASGLAVRLDQDRVVRIKDMSFPHELAVADVVGAESLMRLAKRYDRPVLYDENEGTLFVVESSMLYRCQVAEPVASVAPVLSMVPEPVPAPVVAPPPAPRAKAKPVAEDRPARHRWPELRPTGGRRRPNPNGRDWRYERSV